MKRFICFLFTVMISTLCISANAYAESYMIGGQFKDTADAVNSFDLTETIRAYLIPYSINEYADETDEAYTLIVEGSGDMPDFSGYGSIPWRDDIDSIYRVIIGEGITRVGDFNFVAHDYLYYVSLPNSLKSIGSSAFGNITKGLYGIHIPYQVETLGSFCFSGANNLTGISGMRSVRELGFSENDIGPPSYRTFYTDVFYRDENYNRIYQNVPLTFIDGLPQVLSEYDFLLDHREIREETYHTVTFLIDGYKQERVVMEGDLITKPNIREKEGYICKFYDDETGERFKFLTTPVLKDVNITAVYEEDPNYERESTYTVVIPATVALNNTDIDRYDGTVSVGVKGKLSADKVVNITSSLESTEMVSDDGISYGAIEISGRTEYSYDDDDLSEDEYRYDDINVTAFLHDAGEYMGKIIYSFSLGDKNE